jgi:uncharacterized peroxidase-related enzyme
VAGAVKKVAIHRLLLEQIDRSVYFLPVGCVPASSAGRQAAGQPPPSPDQKEVPMPRIQPVSKDQAPEASKPMLEGIEKKLGKVPNLLGTLGVAPAGLATYLKLGEALEKASLSAKVREQIAVAIAKESGCEYCASAHTAIGKMVGVSADELAKNLDGKASDPKVQGAIDLALAIVSERGWVTDAQFKAAREAGLSDAEIIEVLAITATNLFTNYANHMLQTVNDFPKVEVGAAAR